MAGVRIRDATAADAPAIGRLLDQLGYPEDEETVAGLVERFTAHPDSRVQVAVLGGEVVGFLAVHLVPRFDSERLSLRVVDVVVDERLRGRGIGRALMDAAEAEARRRGATRVDLASGLDRADAHAFYERLGYETRSRAFAKNVE